MIFAGALAVVAIWSALYLGWQWCTGDVAGDRDQHELADHDGRGCNC